MAIVTNILIIGSIVIAIMVMFGVTGIAANVWNIIRHGACWGHLKADVDYFYNSFTKPSLFAPQFRGNKVIELGECVGAIAFINDDELEGFKEEFRSRGYNCEKGEAYIIGIPYYPDTESGWKFWLWPKDILENIANTWNDRVRGMQPYCKALQKPIAGTIEPMLGPNKAGGTDKYCITELYKENDGSGNEAYYVQYNAGPCEEEEDEGDL